VGPQTQHNLGGALEDLGTRTGGQQGTELPAQAVEAYRSALEIFTRQELPQDWVATQNKLGTALKDQGTRTSGQQGTELLVQAVEAYRSALEVRTRQELPQDWAETQNNLANALWTLGDQMQGKKRLQCEQESVATFRKITAWQPNDQSRFALANALGGLAFDLVLNRQFADAQAYRKEAQAAVEKIGDGIQKVERENLIFIEGNLARALLFEGHYEEALIIYSENWNKPLDGKTFGEITLEDFAAFDKAGLTHPDLYRMKQALAKLHSHSSNQ
jgi:tetratricopeptide (TPR) repeat protein